MDWRTVTLVTADGDRVVVANSTLAKGNLKIAARASEKASVTVPLALGVDIPPEQVRDAVIEAGRAVPNLARPGWSPMLRYRHRRWHHQVQRSPLGGEPGNSRRSA